MDTGFLQFWPVLLVAAAVGAAIGWLGRVWHGKRALQKVEDDWLVKFDEATRQRDTFNAENIKLRTTIEAQQAVVHKHELAVSKLVTEIESARERLKAVAKERFTIAAERDDLRTKLGKSVDALDHARRQVHDVENEFVKTGVFYKGELEKSFEKRKLIESRFEDAQAEQESLVNLLEAARAENLSLNNMLTAAQTRLDNLDRMEQKVIELEAENAQMRHDTAVAQQSIDALQRDLDELNELKVQNKELAHCLKSMESSRKQYEKDAKRYREQADKSEKRSETLRLKLDDVEKSFADLAQQQDDALALLREQEQSRQQSAPPEAPLVDQPDSDEVDDLTEIVGIGKVFQETLHSLGIFSFRQIAAFGPADIARVNIELKEFRGRMEQDDWIGQAKELLYRKYGETH